MLIMDSIPPPPILELELPGLLFRQYLIGEFSVGGDGLGSPSQEDHVMVRLTNRGIEAPKIDRNGNVRKASSDFPVDKWRFTEIKSADVFKTPTWARLHGVGPNQAGTRIHLGESRSPILLFTENQAELLSALEAHGVAVNRKQIRLNVLLVGRK